MFGELVEGKGTCMQVRAHANKGVEDKVMWKRKSDEKVSETKEDDEKEGVSRVMVYWTGWRKW